MIFAKQQKTKISARCARPKKRRKSKKKKETRIFFVFRIVGPKQIFEHFGKFGCTLEFKKCSTPYHFAKQNTDSHSKFLFCPDPTTTSPSTFADMVKKKTLRDRIWASKYIIYPSWTKISTEWILWARPKIEVSATLKCATTHDFEVLIVSTTCIHRHIAPSHDARVPPTRTTKPSAPPAVHGRI